MKFLTLVEIEIKKILPWLATLFIGITVALCGLFYRTITLFKQDIMPKLLESSVDEYVKNNGQLTLGKVFDGSSMIPLLLIFAAIILACITFYLWYKEWFGYSKRIYMLLSLKGQRFSIFLSKLLVIVVSFFIFYGVVLLNLAIGGLLMNIILPEGIVANNLIQGALAQSNYIGMILPLTLGDFLYKMLFIILMFNLISVFVLADRSKRILGLIFALIYGIANVVIFVYTKTLFLFVDERFFVDWGFVVVATVLSMGISAWLLNKKVSI